MYTEPIPAGFQLTTLGRDQWLIQHQRTGMGCLNAFLIVWLSIWTTACLGMIYIHLSETPTNSTEEAIPLVLDGVSSATIQRVSDIRYQISDIRDRVRNLRHALLVMVLIFCTIDIAMWCFLLYSMYCKQTFQIDYYNLAITTEILALKWDKTIPKDSIRRIVQVQDGGRGRDSFPSWGLKIEGRKKARLIFRQPYEKSYWLGEFVANWAKVEFVPAPQKPVNSIFR